jgi:hypothetical protein
LAARPKKPIDREIGISGCAFVASAGESVGGDDEYPDPPRQAY